MVGIMKRVHPKFIKVVEEIKTANRSIGIELSDTQISAGIANQIDIEKFNISPFVKKPGRKPKNALF